MDELRRVVVLVLFFWMELVPSLGRELVLCWRAETPYALTTAWGGTGLGLGDTA